MILRKNKRDQGPSEQTKENLSLPGRIREGFTEEVMRSLSLEGAVLSSGKGMLCPERTKGDTKWSSGDYQAHGNDRIWENTKHMVTGARVLEGSLRLCICKKEITVRVVS